MIYIDDTFPYENYKGNGQLFKTYTTTEYDADEFEDYSHFKWQIDYAKELGMYRITRFRDNHWDGDIVFKEVEKENPLSSEEALYKLVYKMNLGSGVGLILGTLLFISGIILQIIFK